MNDFEKLKYIISTTIDGKFFMAWCIIITATGFFHLFLYEITIEEVRFIFYPFLILLVFLRFRMSENNPYERFNKWGCININSLGLLIFYMEFYK